MVALRYSLEPVLEGRAPFSFFMLSAMAAAWYGGLWPGVTALVLGLLAGDYFFVPPIHAIGLHQTGDWILVLGYFLSSSFAILLFEALHSTTRKLEIIGTQLKVELKGRQRTETALREAENQLRQHAIHLEESVRQRTAQLEETVHSLETFSYTVAHNLRGPLRALQGISQATLEDYGAQLDPRGHEYLTRIRDSAVRMDSLICDLLGYDKVAREKPRLEDVSLDHAIRLSLQTLASQILASQARIHISPDLPAVRANESTLVQALTNLLSNGLKFVPPGATPVLEISSSRLGDTVRLEIRDHGIGIPPEHHQRVFEIFERVSDPIYPGNGIGLPIARIGIERMGGKIGVISTPGYGSTFWIELAAVPTLPASPPADSQVALNP